MFKRSHREAGFTLIETMASIVIFSIMTLGAVPLMTSSLKGVSLSRSYTRGKNIAVEAMERARGLPFYIDYPTQKAYSSGPEARRVDLLDLYIPAAASNASGDGGGVYSSGTYTTVCTADTGANPACPRGLPPEYTLEFRAEFVKPVAVGTKEQYEVVVPPEAYKWNPEPYALEDRPPPPSQMVRLVVVAGWEYGGDPKQVELSSIIGNRDFGEVTVAGNSKVEYGVQVTTQFVDESTGQRTELRSIAGSAESEIETKSQSTANQRVQTARLVATDLPTIETDAAVERAVVEGATSSITSPPDSTPSGASVGSQQMDLPVHGVVGGMDGTTTSGLKVSVSQDLPTARGTYGFSAPTGNERMSFVDAQLGPDNDSTLRLNVSEGVLKFTKRGSGTINGSTSAVTTPVGAGRHVLTSATADFERLRLLGTNFIQSTITDANGDAVHRSVVVVNRFRSSVSCTSTASVSTATADKSWSASVYFWSDDLEDDEVAGSYKRIDVSSADPTDLLAEYGADAKNPVVYDAPEGEEDIYLFDTDNTRGYLDSWGSALGEDTSVHDEGRFTQADLSDPLRIVTAPTDSRYEETALVVQMGKLSCQARDDR